VEAIESVRKQTFEDYELIVVDDGSTDETPRELARRFPDIIIVRHPLKKGVSAARNRGITQSRGTYLAFLDSDDLWLPQKLEKEVAFLEENPEIRVCYTDEIWIRKGIRVNPKKRHKKYSGWIFPRCLPLCIISPSSVMIHREIFKTVGTFDESLPVCEDYDLWLRIASRYPVHWLDIPLIIKRGGHPDQLSKALWGMDRFRVKALIKILGTPELSENWRALTEETLKRKCLILIQGFEKRGKTTEARMYRDILSTLPARSSETLLSPRISLCSPT
jgi:glycosyltransferase involved in cell wall biosynthesis